MADKVPQRDPPTRTEPDQNLAGEQPDHEGTRPLYPVIDALSQALFTHMAEGVALHEIVFDDRGRPVNYRIVAVNSSYEAILGLSAENVVGKTADHAYGTPFPPYLKEYTRVAISGEPARLQLHFEPLAKDFDVRVVPWGQRGFVTLFLDVTEHRLSESLLRENEVRWQFALEGSDQGFWDWDLVSGWVSFSRRWMEILGYSPQEATDRDEVWFGRIHPDDRAQCEADLQRHFRRETPFYANEHRVRCRDGDYKWILDRGKVIERDAGGAPRRMIGTRTDISRIKCMETTVAATAEFVSQFGGDDLLQALVRHAADTLSLDYVHLALLTRDRKGVETVAVWLDGQAAPNWSYDLSGTPCAEVVNLARVCVANGVQQAYPLDKDLVSIKAEAYVGEPLVGSSGQALGLLVGIARQPLRDRDLVRANLRILAARAGSEIEQQGVLRALREERDTNRTLLQTVEAIIVALDRDGRISLINRKGCQLLGYEERELIGRDWFETCLPKNLVVDEVRAVFRRALAADLADFEYYENPVRTRSGEERLIAWHNSTIRDNAGNVVGGLSAGEDITDRRRAEQALKESEVKFHTMVNWTYDWEYWVLPDGRFHHMTPSVRRVTGYNPEDFESEPGLVDAIVHPEDRMLWNEHMKHRLHEGASDEVVELDLRIVQKDGGLRWVSHTCRPVFGSDGRYLGRRVAVRDITARREAEEQIRQLAHYDPVTGLPNRRLLMDRLNQALAASNRTRKHHALLILDLDHFKRLNDTQGHDVGDQLLLEVAKRLRRSVRQRDTVARLGGDEYVVLLEYLDTEEEAAARKADRVVEKLRRALDEPYPLSGMEAEHHSTCSIGLTLFRGPGVTAEVLLKQADVALYQAKDAGRNAVRIFNPAMQATIDARAALEAALRRALQRGELRLYYQPQVDERGAVIGAEALLRWQPPGHAPVLPAAFIGIAEESGLIVAIGDWVLRSACAQLQAWSQDHRTRPLVLSINVSARQFYQPDFVEQVRDAIARSAIDATRLRLELTESVVLDDVEEVIRRMQVIKAMGVGFSLDDFGTGYSSLSYLKRLPLDQVKLDKSFVQDVANDSNDAAIVRAVLAMSRSLGLLAVAEGVETQEQRSFLQANGCTAFQGYLFGRPVPVEDWEVLV
jgi:diguanylate cyclase (GGDEF)-like protein/PAS domain S-box-containing protein